VADYDGSRPAASNPSGTTPRGRTMA
jgi:hypothetical protein